MNIPAPAGGRPGAAGFSNRFYHRCLGAAATAAMFLFLVGSPAAFAAPVTGQLCVQDEGGNSCTANDVRITEFECVNCPESCQPGLEYTATVIATVESTPQKYDIGFYFTEDATSAYSGDSCTRDMLEPLTSDLAQCQSSSNADGLGPFKDADGDACGDTPTGCTGIQTVPCSDGGGTCELSRKLVEITTLCVDADDDNIADIHSCTAWSQSEGDACGGPLDAVPGTPSKCHCGYVSTTEIVVIPDCVTDADCSDNNVCDGIEMCIEGECVDSNEPPLSCDDGLYCNGEETCDPMDGCIAGNTVECGDGVSCTVDSCNEQTDSCDNTPNHGACADGAYCNGDEVCDPVNGCEAGEAPACDDSIACTVDSCDEDTDSCDYAPDDNACADGAYCNGDEVCDPQTGCEAGTPVQCGDGVDCTVDACNEETDSCDNTPDDSSCDDGQFCNGEEFCDAIADCQPGAAPDANDQVECTLDECDEVNDVIVHTPFDSACDDGNICDGAEICDEQEGCIEDPAGPLDPGTACGDQTDTACTDPDTCDGEGQCLNNNEVCGALTTSALCEFDVEPDKGVCVGGENDGEACSLGDPDCPDGSCEQTKEFLLGFNTDGNNWKAFRPPFSNPGQFYYNAFYDATLADGDEEITIVVPWPFITQGATPLHVYDGDDVGTLETCFMPGDALLNAKYEITLDDWHNPAGNPDYLSCAQVDGIGESGFCELSIVIPEAVIDAVPSKLLYINLHLDYGLKGNWTDGLPPFGSSDLYDYGADVSPWGSRDALQDTNPGNGPVAIGDCTDYSFSHWHDGLLLYEDSGYNLNYFNIKAKGKKN